MWTVLKVDGLKDSNWSILFCTIRWEIWKNTESNLIIA